MANSAQAKKRARQNEQQRKHNASLRSMVRLIAGRRGAQQHARPDGVIGHLERQSPFPVPCSLFPAPCSLL